MKIILLGKPGAGKGTHAQMLSENFGFNIISTGDIIRNEISSKTEIGSRIEDYVNAGELVPDDLVVNLVVDNIKGEKIIFDGFPRTVEQAEFLDDKLTIDKVFHLDVPDELIINRLISRAFVKKGSETIIFANNDEAKTYVTKNGGEVFKRKDDNKKTITTRLDTYRKKTRPLISFYKERQKLAKIDSSKSIEKVHEEICDHLLIQ